MLSKLLRKAYQKSLEEPRKYYNNQYEFGADTDSPALILYFIHGLGGAPGQVSLLLPTIESILKRPFYVRAMHLPELDVRKPFIERYREGIELKIREKIRQDLAELTERYPGQKILVATSSHGMYDFVLAYPQIPDSIRERLVLAWISCASDEYEQLEKKLHGLLGLMYAVTGFQQRGYKWSFGINHNLLTILNSEASASYHVKDQNGQRITFLKRDIEMRFKCLGIQWTDPSSVTFIRDYQQRQIRNFERITDIKCYVLAALRDGYWFDPSAENIEKTVSRYIRRYDISLVDTSHLWCVIPPVSEPFLRRVLESEVPGK